MSDQDNPVETYREWLHAQLAAAKQVLEESRRRDADPDSIAREEGYIDALHDVVGAFEATFSKPADRT